MGNKLDGACKRDRCCGKINGEEINGEAINGEAVEVETIDVETTA